MSDRPGRSGYEIVREFWKVDPKDDANWRRWLHDGVIPNTAFDPKTVNAAAVPASGNEARGTPPEQRQPESVRGPVEVAFRNDPSVLDGRFANNGWLQELPKPITKLTWDNAVLVGPATAEALRARNTPAFTGGEHGQIISDVVEIRVGGRTIRGGLFPVAGHAEGCATVDLGYGRTRAGNVGNGVGFDANALRTADAAWSAPRAEAVRTGETVSLACTQYHHLMEGRNLIHVTTLEEYLRDPKSMREGEETPPRTITLYPDFTYEGYKWGMAIDVNACIGCNACVVACQAENNIPVVGKDQVLRGREMHWLRIVSY